MPCFFSSFLGPQEGFEDTKEVIRIRKSKNRQHKRPGGMRSVIDLSFSENLPFCSPFQNGDKEINQSLHSTRYMDYHAGSFMCILPHFNCYCFQEIPPFFRKRQQFPISCSPFWSSSSATDVYPSFSNSCNVFAYHGCAGSFVCGRLSADGVQSTVADSSHSPFHHAFPNFLEECRDHAPPLGFLYLWMGLHYRSRPNLFPEENICLCPTNQSCHNFSASGCSEMALSQSIAFLTFNEEVETI